MPPAPALAPPSASDQSQVVASAELLADIDSAALLGLAPWGGSDAGSTSAPRAGSFSSTSSAGAGARAQMMAAIQAQQQTVWFVQPTEQLMWRLLVSRVSASCAPPHTADRSVLPPSLRCTHTASEGYSSSNSPDLPAPSPLCCSVRLRSCGTMFAVGSGTSRLLLPCRRQRLRSRACWRCSCAPHHLAGCSPSGWRHQPPPLQQQGGQCHRW